MTSAEWHLAVANYSAGFSMLLCDLADFGHGSCWHSAGFSMHSICVYKFYTYMPALTSMKAPLVILQVSWNSAVATLFPRVGLPADILAQ